MTSSIMKFSTTCAAIAALTLGVAGASAQQFGSYSGTTSQGLPIAFEIVDDGFGGFAFANFSADFSATCVKTGAVVGSGIGIGFFNPFSGNKVEITFAGDTLYLPIKVKFKANGNATGDVSKDNPAYIDVNGNLNKVQNCGTGPLTFAASPVVAAESVRARLPVGTVTQTPR